MIEFEIGYPDEKKFVFNHGLTARDTTVLFHHPTIHPMLPTYSTSPGTVTVYAPPGTRISVTDGERRRAATVPVPAHDPVRCPHCHRPDHHHDTRCGGPCPTLTPKDTP